MPDVFISNEGPVRKIRINRPEKKNALTLAMYEAMAALSRTGKDGWREVPDHRGRAGCVLRRQRSQ